MNDYKKLKTAYDDNTKQKVKEKYRYYNATGCPAGTYCPNSVEQKNFFSDNCPAGYYCPSVIDPLKVVLKPLPVGCPQNFYCPADSKKPILCPGNIPRSAMYSQSVENCF
jgi:hypothetical protein